MIGIEACGLSGAGTPTRRHLSSEVTVPGLDEETLEFRCEHCGRRLKKRTRWLLRNPRFVCPNCYHEVEAPIHMLTKDSLDFGDERERFPLSDT